VTGASVTSLISYRYCCDNHSIIMDVDPEFRFCGDVESLWCLYHVLHVTFVYGSVEYIHTYIHGSAIHLINRLLRHIRNGTLLVVVYDSLAGRIWASVKSTEQLWCIIHICSSILSHVLGSLSCVMMRGACNNSASARFSLITPCFSCYGLFNFTAGAVRRRTACAN
jgi:hypothetical protein